MLEFIVLGLIPGTHVQINFLGVLYSVAIALSVTDICLFWQRRHFKKHQAVAIKSQSIKNIQSISMTVSKANAKSKSSRKPKLATA